MLNTRTQEPLFDTELVIGGHTRRVLICDDSATVRQFLREVLVENDSIVIVGEAADSEASVSLALELRPDAVLMDVRMPSAGGVEATRQIRQRLRDTQVIALTTDEDPATVDRMIEAGATGYLVKRSSPLVLRQAIERALGHAHLDERVVGGVFESVARLYRRERELTLGIVAALAAGVEARDGTTAAHIQRVTGLAKKLIGRVAPDLLELPYLEFGLMLHDVGKLGVRDQVLRKAGPLTSEELIEMRQHVEIGVRILEPIPGFEAVRDFVFCHQECWDGTGYPRGLRGGEIPLATRLFAVCDAFDAMARDRPYRRALSTAEALAELERNAGHQFDPQAVESFLDLARAGAFGKTGKRVGAHAA